MGMQDQYAWNGGDPSARTNSFAPQTMTSQQTDRRPKTENYGWQPSNGYVNSRIQQYPSTYQVSGGGNGHYMSDGPPAVNYASNFSIPPYPRNASIPDPNPYASNSVSDNASYAARDAARAEAYRYSNSSNPPEQQAFPRPQNTAERRVPYTGPLSEHPINLQERHAAVAHHPPQSRKPPDQDLAPPPPPRDRRPPTPEFPAYPAPASAPASGGSRFSAFRDPKTHPAPAAHGGGLPRGPPGPAAAAPASAASRWLADAASFPLLLGGGAAGGGFPQEVSSTVICDLGEMDAGSPRIPQAPPPLSRDEDTTPSPLRYVPPQKKKKPHLPPRSVPSSAALLGLLPARPRPGPAVPQAP